MAWAEQRGATWRAAWRDGNGQLHRKSGFRHKPTALKYAFAEEATAATANLSDAKATFGDWLDRWLKVRNVEASTDKRDRERIDKHVRPQWGDVQVRKITKLAAEEWVSELDEVLSAWTVRRVWFNFATPLRWSYERGARLASPLPFALSKGTLPTPGPGHERYLERDLLPAVEEQLTGAPLIAVQLLFGTGMRFSELAGLHRHRVDLDQQVLHIVETWDRDGQQMKPYPKSRQAREVPLADWLCESLKTWFEQPDSGSCGEIHEAGTLCQSALVVRGVKGRPLNREHFANDTYKPALEAAGAPRLRIHDARHTFASWLLQAGRSLPEVSELLGHHSIVVTQKYSHLGGSHWAGVRDALSRGSAAPPEPPPGEQKGSSGVQGEGRRLHSVKPLAV